MRKYFLLTIPVLIGITAFSAFPAARWEDGIPRITAAAVTAVRDQTEQAANGVNVDDIYSEFPEMDRSYPGLLPWENNPQFLAAQQKYGVPVRMAAYRATLHDPLPGEGDNIRIAAEKLCGTIVKNGAIFSQNHALGPYTRRKGYQLGPTYAGSKLETTVGGGVCKIASLLYNLALFSDLTITMRYSHSMTVPYVPPGQDATVFYGSKDFRFKNTSGGPILIWAQKVDNTLFMAFYGSKEPPRVLWHHKALKRFPYWTVKRRVKTAPPHTERVVLDGQEGLIIKSWVTVETPDGEVVKNRGVSFYSPSPEVIEYGPSR